MYYTLIKNSSGYILSISRSDGASIPTDPANADYQQFLEETSGITVPEEIIPEPSPARDLAAELDIVQAVIDDMILGGV